jgi:hypoxanthine phosphoribosyltransferase
MDLINIISFAVAIFSLVFAYYTNRQSKLQIQNLVNHLTLRPTEETVNWERVSEGLDRIHYMLVKGPHAYKPDLLLGVGGGGAAIADMLSVRLWLTSGTRLPVYIVNIKKEYRPPASQPPETSDTYLMDWVRGKRVLLIEDFFLGGESLMQLVTRIKSLKPRELRIFVFAVPSRVIEGENFAHLGENIIIEYHCITSNSMKLSMPWGRV